MSSSITVHDRGYARLFRGVKGLKGAAITVGVHEAEGSEPADDGDQTVAEVAMINEVGAGDIPARSWLAAWVEERHQENQRLLRGAAEEIVQGATPREALGRAGAVMAGNVQERISDGIPPENAPSTLAQKSGDTPLIDKGQFRQSIGHKVSP